MIIYFGEQRYCKIKFWIKRFSLLIHQCSLLWCWSWWHSIWLQLGKSTNWLGVFYFLWTKNTKPTCGTRQPHAQGRMSPTPGLVAAPPGPESPSDQRGIPGDLAGLTVVGRLGPAALSACWGGTGDNGSRCGRTHEWTPRTWKLSTLSSGAAIKIKHFLFFSFLVL